MLSKADIAEPAKWPQNEGDLQSYDNSEMENQRHYFKVILQKRECCVSDILQEWIRLKLFCAKIKNEEKRAYNLANFF